MKQSPPQRSLIENQFHINELLDLTSTIVSTVSPFFGLLLKSVQLGSSIAISEKNKKKLESRLRGLSDSIEYVNRKIASYEHQYESMILSQEVFRDYLVTADSDKAKTLLQSIIYMYSNYIEDFDGLRYALKIINELSPLELKILQEIGSKLLSPKELIATDLLRDRWLSNQEFIQLTLDNLYVNRYIISSRSGAILGGDTMNVRIHDDKGIYCTAKSKLLLSIISKFQNDEIICHE